MVEEILLDCPVVSIAQKSTILFLTKHASLYCQGFPMVSLFPVCWHIQFIYRSKINVVFFIFTDVRETAHPYGRTGNMHPKVVESKST